MNDPKKIYSELRQDDGGSKPILAVAEHCAVLWFFAKWMYWTKGEEEGGGGGERGVGKGERYTASRVRHEEITTVATNLRW